MDKNIDFCQIGGGGGGGGGIRLDIENGDQIAMPTYWLTLSTKYCAHSTPPPLCL